MAFPVVEQVVENSTNTAGTNHTINLPTATAGQLLLIILDKGSTAATVNAHASLTELLDENLGNGLYIAYRWMDGSEPASYTLVTSGSTRTSSFAYRISGAVNPATTAPQIGTTGTGTSATPDPPASATPPSTKDYLFIAFAGMAGEEADDDTWGNTPPTNYTPNPPRQKSCGTAGTNLGGLILAAERQLNTGSAENPGTFGVDVSAAWRSQTITIHPDPNVTLSAGANTINVSAPDPTVHLLIPAGANTINVSAPAQTEVHAITLAAGAQTINVSAPDATGVFGSGGVTLSAGDQTININAPDVTVHLTIPAGQQTINISAPTATIHTFTSAVLVDDFNRADEQPAANWTDYEGISFQSAIVSNRFKWTGGNGGGMQSYFVPAKYTTPVDISVDFPVISASGFFGIQLIQEPGIGTDTHDGYSLAWLPSSGEWILERGENGFGTNYLVLFQGAGSSGNFAAGDSMGLRLTAGGDLSFYHKKSGQTNWTLITTVNDTLLSGSFYISLLSSNSTAQFDNVMASSSNITLENVGSANIQVSAPAQTELHEITLAAGANTINVSAPAPTVHLLIPAGLVQISISAPDATLVEEGTTNLSAGGNTINVSAPAVTVHLTTLAGLQQINISAPTGTVLAEISLTAGGTEIQVSAPSTTMHLSIPAGGNTVEITAPLAIIPPTLLAGANTIFISAPDATIGNALDNVLEAGTPIVRIIVPIHTFKQTFPGAMRRMDHDASMELVTFDVAELARETNHEARSARNVEDSQVVITT